MEGRKGKWREGKGRKGKEREGKGRKGKEREGKGGRVGFRNTFGKWRKEKPKMSTNNLNGNYFNNIFEYIFDL